HSIYIYDAALGVICYDIDEQAVKATAPPFPEPIDSIVYVDATDELILVSIGFDQIFRYDRDLTEWTSQRLPAGHNLEHGVQLEVAPPATGFPPDPIQLWAWAPGSRDLHRLLVN